MQFRYPRVCYKPFTCMTIAKTPLYGKSYIYAQNICNQQSINYKAPFWNSIPWSYMPGRIKKSYCFPMYFKEHENCYFEGCLCLSSLNLLSICLICTRKQVTPIRKTHNLLLKHLCYYLIVNDKLKSTRIELTKRTLVLFRYLQ